MSNPSDSVNFAYVGTRTTGTLAADYPVTGLGWKGYLPGGMTQMSSLNNLVLVIGRSLVVSDSDLSTAYHHSKGIGLTALSRWNLWSTRFS